MEKAHLLGVTAKVIDKQPGIRVFQCRTYIARHQHFADRVVDMKIAGSVQIMRRDKLHLYAIERQLVALIFNGLVLNMLHSEMADETFPNPGRVQLGPLQSLIPQPQGGDDIGILMGGE